MRINVTVFLCLLLMVLSVMSCTNKWAIVGEGVIVKIDIKGVGGWGSPNAIRVWTLDSGHTFSMASYKNVDVKVGDYIIVKKCIGGWNRWSGSNRLYYDIVAR